MNWRRAVVAFVAPVLLSSCSSGEAAITGKWQPYSVPDAVLIEPFPGEDHVLQLSEGKFTAHDGCNDFDYTGSYELEGTDFRASFDAYSAVGGDCEYGNVGYPQLLDQARSAAVVDGALVLRDSQGDVIAEFSRVSD